MRHLNTLTATLEPNKKNVRLCIHECVSYTVQPSHKETTWFGYVKVRCFCLKVFGGFCLKGLADFWCLKTLHHEIGEAVNFFF